MKYKLVKIEELSGEGASIYTVKFENQKLTLFEKFLEEYTASFKNEIANITKRIEHIGKKRGALEHYFKPGEGGKKHLYEAICALHDEPDSNLRLYCIRYSKPLIILGSGGHKPKNIRKFQESEKLTRENYFLRELDDKITERIKNNDIRIVNYGYDFEGNLEFEGDNYE